MNKETDVSDDFPWWFYWKPLHDSHKASLKRKSSEYYMHFEVDEIYMKHGYIWPTKINSRKMYICEMCECL
jgi:hypothetical protein